MMAGAAAAFSFVTKHWRLAALGLAVLAFVLMLVAKNVQIGALERRIEALDGQIAALQRDLGTCRTNTATLQAGIERQGAELERVQTASNTRVANLTRDLERERQTAQTAQQRAAAVLARRPGADQCADALSIIRGG